MAKITLKINGQEVQVEKGSTILEAAKEAGVYVPTLCYHPYLPLEEACRICVVEDVRRGWSTLVAACVFPVREGMVIETDSEMVRDSRRTILELLLSDHPNECMTCQATGECELQDLAYRFRVNPEAYQGERHKREADSDPHPQLHIDMNKCVLCRRCIRACHDIQGADVWTKVGRGFDQRISTAFELPLLEAGCESCGHCADFCPVDAISFRAGRGEVRPWQMAGGSTICLQCAMGCRLRYDTHGGKVVRVKGAFGSPANNGALCKKGRFNFDFINSPDRLIKAFIRKDGDSLVEAELSECVQTAAQALSAIRDQDGGGAIGVVTGGMLTNEEYYVAQKLARGALFTNNVDSAPGPWQIPVYEGLSSSMGMGAMTNSTRDIGCAQSLLIMGSNTLEEHAIAALMARKAVREGATMIVAHPDEAGLVKNAECHLPIQAGSEDALVLALMKTIVDEGLYDKGFVEKYAQDFDKLVRSLEKISMAELSEKTGLGEDDLREAARLYAGKRPACLVYGMGAAAKPESETFYRMCAALQILLGSVGIAGGGVNILAGSGNAVGAVAFGASPKYLPGYRPATHAASKKMIGKMWGVEPPAGPGMSWPEMFEAMKEGRLKALYFIGVNPFELGWPEGEIAKALGKLQLLIVQDCVKTEVTNLAHIVLPGAAFIEKQGSAINSERRLQKLDRVMDPPGGAKADFEIINEVLKAMNESLAFATAGDAFNEARQLQKDLGELGWKDLGEAGVQLPVGRDGAGTERLELPASDKGKFKFYAARL